MSEKNPTRVDFRRWTGNRKMADHLDPKRVRAAKHMERHPGHAEKFMTPGKRFAKALKAAIERRDSL